MEAGRGETPLVATRQLCGAAMSVKLLSNIFIAVQAPSLSVRSPASVCQHTGTHSSTSGLFFSKNQRIRPLSVNECGINTNLHKRIQEPVRAITLRSSGLSGFLPPPSSPPSTSPTPLPLTRLFLLYGTFPSNWVLF